MQEIFIDFQEVRNRKISPQKAPKLSNFKVFKKFSDTKSHFNLDAFSKSGGFSQKKAKSEVSTF